MSRAVFVAVGVYGWNPSNPAQTTFSLTRGGGLETIDSTRRPAGGASVQGAIVDDHQSAGGATTVAAAGGDGSVYVELTYAQNKDYPMPPVGYREYATRRYEFQTVQYSADDAEYAKRRYYGFHALWIDGERSKATLLIFDAGDSRGAGLGKVVRYTANLDDAELILPEQEMPSGAPPVRGSGNGGGIFLRCSEAQNLSLGYPKLPPSMGEANQIISASSDT